MVWGTDGFAADLHESVVGEVAVESVSQSCHGGEELVVLVEYLDVAIWQFAVVEHFGADSGEGVA